MRGVKESEGPSLWMSNRTTLWPGLPGGGHCGDTRKSYLCPGGPAGQPGSCYICHCQTQLIINLPCLPERGECSSSSPGLVTSTAAVTADGLLSAWPQLLTAGLWWPPPPPGDRLRLDYLETFSSLGSASRASLDWDFRQGFSLKSVPLSLSLSLSSF